MLCPLIKSDCVERKCAWYDSGNKCCAVLGLVIENIGISEAVDNLAMGRSSARVTVNPIVQVKEVIKTIPITKDEHVSPTALSDQASESAPKISW